MMEEEALRAYQGEGMGKALSGIRLASKIKEKYAEAWIVENARRAVALAALHGNLHIRAFADVDSKARLEGVKALLRVRDEFRGIVDLQVVAFAQDGIVREPGAAALMHQAMALGADVVGGIPWIVIVAALMLLAGHLVLTYTRFGRYVYMVGGNREAAEYSGLNVKLILGSVMVISAVCSGIGGMLGVAHSAARSRTSSIPICSIPSLRWWSAAPACSAAAAASATPLSACSCLACSTTGSIMSISTAS